MVFRVLVVLEECREIRPVIFCGVPHYIFTFTKKHQLCLWGNMPLVLARTHTSFITGATRHHRFDASI